MGDKDGFSGGGGTLNICWRLDYCLASDGLECSEPEIHDRIKGSDHCPVSVRVQADLG